MKKKTIQAWGVVVQEYRYVSELSWAWAWNADDILPFVTHAFFRTRCEARDHAKKMLGKGLACKARVVRVTLPAPEGVK